MFPVGWHAADFAEAAQAAIQNAQAKVGIPDWFVSIWYNSVY